MMRLKTAIENLSLRAKLGILTFVLIVPFLVMTAFLLYHLDNIGRSYDTIVQNVTRANQYNIAFREEMDAVVYQMIARSLTKNEVEEALGMKDPDRLITEAESTFDSLQSTSNSPGAKERIRSIIKLMITLRKRMNDINDSINEPGSYDENMMSLDADIRILTELIQERITEYIYYEAASMENIRAQMEYQRLNLVRYTVLLVVFLSVLAVLLSLFITRSITKPVGELCRVTERVGLGDFSIRAEAEGSNEIATLGNSFNSMIGQIGLLVENIREEQINSRNLELKLLQAQINPHFLYNTLDNIVWLAEDGRTEDVEAIVTALSQFFRTTLAGGRDFIRIREEIGHIEAYLSIQTFRYRDILSYEIDIPEEYHEYLIIKMTLQPVVENALYHGIKNKRGRGTIRIGIEDLGDSLKLIVSDNGIGMKEEELARIRRIVNGEEQPGEDNSGFGAANIAERLRLSYGDRYGLSFHSTYGEGTKVEILIPKTASAEDFEQNQ